MSYIEVKLSRRSIESIIEALQFQCLLGLHNLKGIQEYEELKIYFEQKLNGEEG